MTRLIRKGAKKETDDAQSLAEENCHLKENIREMLKTNDIVDEHMDRLIEKNRVLEEKLDIAVKALEFYASESKWFNCLMRIYTTQEYINITKGCLHFNGFTDAKEALEKIKEIK